MFVVDFGITQRTLTLHVKRDRSNSCGHHARLACSIPKTLVSDIKKFTAVKLFPRFGTIHHPPLFPCHVDWLCQPQRDNAFTCTNACDSFSYTSYRHPPWTLHGRAHSPKNFFVGLVFSTCCCCCCCCGAASKLPVEIDRMNLVSFSTRRVRMARTGIDNA